MKTTAYIRVSTDKQDLNNQKLTILDYAHKNKLQIDNFIEIQMSSQKSKKERKIDQLLAELAPGYTLVVSELSRLGRSLGEIIYIVNELTRQEIKLIAIKENINFRGKQDMQTKIMVAMFGLFAEIERDLISERTKQALAAVRAKGKKLGRPKGSIGKSRLDGREEEIKLLLGKKVSKSSIAKIMDISRPALYRFIETRNLK
ncbi:MAG: recombinase family protein [Candidatus Margulisiibacteriota bacterium]